MNSIPGIIRMVQVITVLTILKMLADAQTTCNGGLGRVVYERLPDQQLQGFDDDVVRDSAPPFRVLEKCQDLCLRDRTATNNLVRACTSFDFQPGNRISSFSGAAEYEESTCYLTREQSQPEGIGNLMMVPNSIYFAEVCLTSNRIERECPNRRYVFERHTRKKLKLSMADTKEVSTPNRTECENRCLNEFNFVCRSATYDAALRSCTLSRFTKRTHPDLLEDDPNSDYLENTCLNVEHRCDGLAVFVKEENKRLRGPFEVDIYTNLTLIECQALCIRAEKYFCRSVEFDDQSRQCIISEEDSVSQRDDIGISNSPSSHFYDLVCLDNPRGSEYPNNGASHFFTDGRRPDTAFQRYRMSRLSGEFHSEITGRSLSECLDECLRQTSFQCRSIVYSEHYRTCRLSKFSQRDGHRIIYDADYDYYENLMHQYVNNGDRDGYKPDPLGQDTNYGRPSLGKPGYLDDFDKTFPPKVHKYPDRIPDRYPDQKFSDQYPDRYFDRYPFSGGRYPPFPPSVYPYADYDRYPSRYPPLNRPFSTGPYPRDRYQIRDRYPNIDKYPIGDDRFPVKPERYPTPSVTGPGPGPAVNRPYNIGPDRYPATRTPGRYSPRYPVSINPTRVLPGGLNYPSTVERYPPAVDRYPVVDNSVDRHPVTDRYPEKDIYPYPDRRPTYHTKDYDRPYNFGNEVGPYGPSRPVDYPNYNEGDVVGGGYIGEGGIYQTKPFGNGGGPIIGRPPVLSRCDDQEHFRQVDQHTRIRKPFIRRYTTASSLSQCERECSDARDFVCRSFNYRPFSSIYGADRDNCELSDRDSRDMEKGNPIYYNNDSDYDLYERNGGQSGFDECLDVSQVCNEDGMEFTLRSPEGFIGRIYTYGHYDRCFFRGNGGTVNVLRISGAQGYPECGTQRYGDTMTNIVVVQFSDYVQTGRDKRYNLTCRFRGPDETVVTSGYIGAGRSGAPIPIEYLPAENTLSSRIRLLILYQGRPTTTIAVGDPLTFRLEAQDGFSYPTDIFATNVIARDPYSGRSVQLIDRYGCPVDNYVFPGLDRLRDGDSLEARFNAFKIPESNFLVFEATVRTCRNGCQPAYCSSNTGRSEPSFGRRRRDVSNDSNTVPDDPPSFPLNNKIANNSNEVIGNIMITTFGDNQEERVREMIEVYESRMDIEVDEKTTSEQTKTIETVCIESNEYYSLITSVITLVFLLILIAFLIALINRKYIYALVIKNRKNNKSEKDKFYSTDIASNPENKFFMKSNLHESSQIMSVSRSLSHTFNQRNKFGSSYNMKEPAGPEKDYKIEFDPSESIYTDPALFEVTSHRTSNLDSSSFHGSNFLFM